MDLDNDRYYQEIDHVYKTYGPTQDHIPVNQAPGPHCTTQELIQAFGRGRDKARREELHGTDPLEPRHDPCRAEFNERSRKPNACDRGM